MQIMLEVGGIYLDADSIILKNLDRFRDFNITLGHENLQTVRKFLLELHCIGLEHLS